MPRKKKVTLSYVCSLQQLASWSMLWSRASAKSTFMPAEAPEGPSAEHELRSRISNGVMRAVSPSPHACALSHLVICQHSAALLCPLPGSFSTSSCWCSSIIDCVEDGSCLQGHSAHQRFNDLYQRGMQTSCNMRLGRTLCPLQLTREACRLHACTPGTQTMQMSQVFATRVSSST